MQLLLLVAVSFLSHSGIILYASAGGQADQKENGKNKSVFLSYRRCWLQVIGYGHFPGKLQPSLIPSTQTLSVALRILSQVRMVLCCVT